MSRYFSYLTIYINPYISTLWWGGKRMDFGLRQIYAPMPLWKPPCCVTWGKSHHGSEVQFPILQK